jgi:hypothetical protein
MSLNVKLSWSERFINWFPYNTRLYIRKKKGVEPNFSTDGKELFDQLAPFFDKLKEEARREGYEEAINIWEHKERFKVTK